MTATALAVPADSPAATARAYDQGNSLRGFKRVIEYTGARGEANALTVRADGGHIVFKDAAATVKPDGCAPVDAHTVRCPTNGTAVLTIRTGDRDDDVSLGGGLLGYAEAYGGSGRDRLTSEGSLGRGLSGESGDDVLVGSSGNDHIIGGAGRDRLAGGDGDDYLTGDNAAGQGSPRGSDVLDGGRGRDNASYAAHSTPVSVDLRRRDGQGSRGENDRLKNIEDVTGGSGGDDLRGDGGPNALAGSSPYSGLLEGGDDVVRGRGGDDWLAGSAGDDRLFGGDGSDNVRAGAGRDLAAGQAGDDHIFLAEGGGEGHRGRAACGEGHDDVTGTSAPTIVGLDCERAAFYTGVVGASGIRVRENVVEIPVSGTREFNQQPPACAVRIQLAGPYPGRGSPPAIGSAGGGLRADGSMRILSIQLNRAGRRLMAQARRVPIRVSVRPYLGCGPGEQRYEAGGGQFTVRL